MSKDTVFVGMHVHAETIVVAVAEGRNSARSLGTIPNRPEAVRRLIKRLGTSKNVEVCYEAGPTGYALYWQLTELGVHCDVVAPSLVPKKASDRVKTDRRDAERLARSYWSDDLTFVWVPDADHEALRDLVRARAAVKQDELRAKHRLGNYLLRYGQRPAEGVRAWTAAWWQWVRALELPHANQNVVLLDHILEIDQQSQRLAQLEQAIDAAIVEAPAQLRGRRRRAADAARRRRAHRRHACDGVRQLRPVQSCKGAMSYTGLVASEHSSGPKSRRGAITKSGNAHLRRVLVEAAWQYRHRPKLGKRQKELGGPIPKIAAIAWQAQHRLHRRYWQLSAKSKPRGKVVTALARELVGFVWAIGAAAEQHHQQRQSASTA